MSGGQLHLSGLRWTALQRAPHGFSHRSNATLRARQAHQLEHWASYPQRRSFFPGSTTPTTKTATSSNVRGQPDSFTPIASSPGPNYAAAPSYVVFHQCRAEPQHALFTASAPPTSSALPPTRTPTTPARCPEQRASKDSPTNEKPARVRTGFSIRVPMRVNRSGRVNAAANAAESRMTHAVER